MKKRLSRHHLALLAVTATAFLILLFVFARVIKAPNQYLYSAHGDAVKSYYNFCYYLRYDSGIRHDGVNYPYGDHLQYMNSHPLYVQLIKFIDTHVYPLADHGVGVLNLTMIFALLLAVPFLFLILRKFALPPLYASITALIILFLTPQLDRIGGHFEMVYAFFIPLYWYLLILWQEGKRRGLMTVLLLLTALAGGFTSAYYSALLMLLPFAVLLVEIWNHRRDLRSYLKEGISLLMIAVLPLVMVKGVVSFTDWAGDRPDNPWGFFIFHSNLFSIFLPPRSMLTELTNNWSALKFQWEGRAYVGLPATLTAISFVFWVVLLLLQKRKPEWRQFFPDRKMNTYLAASILVLIFSMGIPFNWGLEFLTDLLPPLKQFRCLGRFSWIFYYTFTVYTAVILYKFYRRSRLAGAGIAATIVVVFALFYWGLEAGSNVKRSTQRIFNPNELLEASPNRILARFDKAGVDPGEFQAILFLPYANTCGDKMMFSRGLEAFSLAMACSFQTGLPIVESFSPRLSFSQAMSSIQLLSDPAIYKTRVDDMNEKPLLLVIRDEELNEHELRLASKAEAIWQGEGVTYARLAVSAFNEDHSKWKAHYLAVRDSLSCAGSVCSTNAPENIIYRDFDDESTVNSFTGPGALYLKKGSVELLNEDLSPRFGTEPVEISFWLFLDHRTDNMPEAELIITDGDGRQVERRKIETRSVHDTDGLWVRISTELTPVAGQNCRLTLKGKYITVDDLLVKPVNSEVLIRKGTGSDLFNNFRVEKD
ncbi:MAG: hypothetical protein ACOYXB_02000 [Bacteroidota bacterium]